MMSLETARSVRQSLTSLMRDGDRRQELVHEMIITNNQLRSVSLSVSLSICVSVCLLFALIQRISVLVMVQKWLFSVKFLLCISAFSCIFVNAFENLYQLMIVIVAYNRTWIFGWAVSSVTKTKTVIVLGLNKISLHDVGHDGSIDK